MKSIIGLALAGLLVLGAFPAPTLATDNHVKVMTRNQYLGADLTPVIQAQTPAEFFSAVTAVLEQIRRNNFPWRVQRLATEIALTQPDVIGLQEVFDFKLNGRNHKPPFVDHLAETLAALAARGQHYRVAASVTNLQATIPVDVDGDGEPEQVSLEDRDVILVRKGIKFAKLAGNTTEGGLCGVPIPNPVPVPTFPETLQSRPSADGCHYTIVAKVDSPVGEIVVERGFVGIDATVRGKNHRFVNTHLELKPDPADPNADPNSGVFQFLQSVELVGTLQALTPDDRTLILLGDFNSSPEDPPIGSIVPPYQILTGAGFVDILDNNRLAVLDPDGFTCCQEADLSNRVSDLNERIDLIFVSDPGVRADAVVTGRVPIFPLFLPPNWASDHGGVFSKLLFSW